MKLHIQGNDHDLRLTLPAVLVFNRYVLRFVLGHIRIGDTEIKGLSRRQAKTLSAEIRRIKKTRGSWKLVEVSCADGDQVTVTI